MRKQIETQKHQVVPLESSVRNLISRGNILRNNFRQHRQTASRSGRGRPNVLTDQQGEDGGNRQEIQMILFPWIPASPSSVWAGFSGGGESWEKILERDTDGEGLTLNITVFANVPLYSLKLYFMIFINKRSLSWTYNVQESDHLTWRTLLVRVCLKNEHQMSLLTLKTESLRKAAKIFLRWIRTFFLHSLVILHFQSGLKWLSQSSFWSLP